MSNSGFGIGGTSGIGGQPGSYNPWNPPKVISEVPDLVADRFEQVQEYTDQAFATLDDLMGQLKGVFTSASMPTTDISYAYINENLTPNVLTPPLIPTSLSPKSVSAPKDFNVQQITVPTFNYPNMDFTPPNTTLIYNEEPFSSAVAINLRTVINNYILNGGTGLGATTEDAIWQRARDRQAILDEQAYAEIEEYFSSRGWDIPPGALSGRLQEANQTSVRNLTQLNAEIATKQGDLAWQATQAFLTAGIQLETAEREHANAVAQRAFELARSSIDYLIKVYEAKINGYVAQVQILGIQADVEKTRAGIVADINSSNVQKYSADIEKYKAQLSSEMDIIKSMVSVYTLNIQGYDSQARLAASNLEGQIALFNAKISQSNNQTNLSLKEAEIVMQNYLGLLNINVETVRSSANLAAQIAASSLSGISASASLGHQTGESQQHSVSYQTSVSQTYSTQIIISE